MFAVTVHFTLKPGKMAGFMPIMSQNAATSLTAEPGCHRFDICTDPERPDEVFLYELYEDRAAFDAHLSSPHYDSFDALVAELIAEKRVTTYSCIET